MNSVCKTCDTRNRLGMCLGKDGDFTYCFRPVGSVSNIPGNITPFNTIDELLKNNKWLDVIEGTVYLDDEYYGCDKHMKLLLGLFNGETEENIKSGKRYPIGFVTC